MAEGGVPRTERPFNPGSCDMCHQELRMSEISFRTFRCYKHCICEYCDEYPDEITNQRRGTCPICVPTPEGPRQLFSKGINRQREESQQNIVIVAAGLNNVMETGSFLARDLAYYLSEIRAGNVFIVVDNSSPLQRQISYMAHNVSVLNCGEHDDDIWRLRKKIRAIGSLVGFVPSTWHKTAKIKEAYDPERTLLLIHDDKAAHMIKHLRGQDIGLFSLGPKIYSSVESQPWIRFLPHKMLVPPVSDEYFVNINDEQTPDFQIIFPLVIQPDVQGELKKNLGSDMVLKAIDRMKQDTNATIIIRLVLDRSMVNNTKSIRDVFRQYPGLEPQLTFFTNELNWIDTIGSCDLAICPSTSNTFPSWLYRLMNKEIPFLVPADSDMGVLLKHSYLKSIVENYEDDWYRALCEIQKDRDGEKINFCAYKQAFSNEYKEGFHPIATFICGEQVVTLDVVAADRNPEAIDECNTQLRRTCTALKNAVNPSHLLDKCKISIKRKCMSTRCLPRDFEIERRIINLHRAFQKIDSTITHVSEGSLVIHTTPNSNAAILSLEEMKKSGDLLDMISRHLKISELGKDGMRITVKTFFPVKKRPPTPEPQPRIVTSRN